MSKSIYILQALRTPIGSPAKGLKDYSAAQLGSIVIKEIVRRSKIKAGSIDEVVLGNTVGAGTGQNLARQAAVMAGLPVSIPAYTVNNVCGAGLQSVFLAAQAIQAGHASLVLAGGTESATHCPFLSSAQGKDKKPVAFQESLLQDGLLCPLTGKRMGDLAEWLARDSGISRQAQDRFAWESHRRAVEAQSGGKFRQEIVSVKMTADEFFKDDDRPRKNIKLETLAALPAAFVKNGCVTAGNSSVPSDGAAAVVAASEEAVKKEKLKPLARILGYAAVAVEPQKVFTAAVPAIEKCLKQCRLSLTDIDLFEISEAFAVQAIYTQQTLKIPEKKINIYGGDIALGHPLGAAGTRILVTLTQALVQEEKKLGLVCICLGGGGCLAMIIENTVGSQI
ncbi:MAG: hypothetical protein A2787_09290 [Omnitrophica WOR_2 bacterium RIFCSPHIGHO2_01_FULL_48_9]|nr:MAG: hypothetical protein A3D10_03360 [Omnitrophica WOR_2 bacterium RIFCSPHIGHO2_02_FULL_48_11]OGX30908.1 MAG: hypothetical protein A2787_09290 [Omnitrophica WOR_2 bacterium RIFCSPHIGHO2_01_FULL_48_9]